VEKITHADIAASELNADVFDDFDDLQQSQLFPGLIVQVTAIEIFPEETRYLYQFMELARDVNGEIDFALSLQGGGRHGQARELSENYVPVGTRVWLRLSGATAVDDGVSTAGDPLWEFVDYGLVWSSPPPGTSGTIGAGTGGTIGGGTGGTGGTTPQPPPGPTIIDVVELVCPITETIQVLTPCAPIGTIGGGTIGGGTIGHGTGTFGTFPTTTIAPTTPPPSTVPPPTTKITIPMVLSQGIGFNPGQPGFIIARGLLNVPSSPGTTPIPTITGGGTVGSTPPPTTPCIPYTGGFQVMTITVVIGLKVVRRAIMFPGIQGEPWPMSDESCDAVFEDLCCPGESTTGAPTTPAPGTGGPCSSGCDWMGVRFPIGSPYAWHQLSLGSFGDAGAECPDPTASCCYVGDKDWTAGNEVVLHFLLLFYRDAPPVLVVQYSISGGGPCGGVSALNPVVNQVLGTMTFNVPHGTCNGRLVDSGIFVVDGCIPSPTPPPKPREAPRVRARAGPRSPPGKGALGGAGVVRNVLGPTPPPAPPLP
jgi:hypothetical protein